MRSGSLTNRWRFARWATVVSVVFAALLPQSASCCCISGFGSPDHVDAGDDGTIRVSPTGTSGSDSCCVPRDVSQKSLRSDSRSCCSPPDRLSLQSREVNGGVICSPIPCCGCCETSAVPNVLVLSSAHREIRLPRALPALQTNDTVPAPDPCTTIRCQFHQAHSRPTDHLRHQATLCVWRN